QCRIDRFGIVQVRNMAGIGHLYIFTVPIALAPLVNDPGDVAKSVVRAVHNENGMLDEIAWLAMDGVRDPTTDIENIAPSERRDHLAQLAARNLRGRGSDHRFALEGFGGVQADQEWKAREKPTFPPFRRDRAAGTADEDRGRATSRVPEQHFL